ncbi:hypothetical protein NGRA_0520 [Nosema granulosis]|uniref:Uncharacterized protein n=1 Tax=Nosema granulosis TaxID=83296 RepID=A0A9P6H0S8_9MICR|nr:hypothetical protein NGRA_0520 [Nosema granulosis]
MLSLLFIGFFLATKVTISPIRNKYFALSYSRKDAHTSTFNFISKSRINQTLRTCMTPLVVPLKNSKHRLYFCGELMCLSKKGLTICDRPTRDAEFDLMIYKDMFLIGKDGMCMHVNEGNIFLRRCNHDSQEQLFYIDRVQVAPGDNSDIAPSLREEGRGNRLLLADNAFRKLSQIKNAEFIRELYDNEMRYELVFSNHEEQRRLE